MFGIFDSGLGGLTVLRHVRARLPDADLVFLADQANVPYGDRSTGDLAMLLARNVAYLDARGVAAIVMGCNTSCAIAARRGWPHARATVLDLIAAAASDVAASGARRVGVIATTATAASGAYGDAIRALAPGTDVVEIAAPRLVPLVEAGVLDGRVARDAVARACEPFGDGLDALVLACTHYPLLDGHFAAVLGPGVRRFDPAVAQAERVVAFARAHATPSGTGRTTYVTTGDLAPFERAVIALVADVRPHDSFARASLDEMDSSELARASSSDEMEDAEEDQHRGGAERGARDDLQHGVRA